MLKDWITEIRPRTLLLSASNCALGCALGFFYGVVNFYNLIVALLIILTGMLLQIISNLANDYGDAFRGSDSSGRLGPIRSIMTGAITLTDLKKAMLIVIGAACITGFCAVYMSVNNDINTLAWFLFLGVVSITAALFYTIGMAYGYKGLGDIAVFIFFGVLAVLGPQVMVTNASGGGIEIYPDTVLLCFAVGFGSVMVLHVANMRDIAEDKINGKRTIAVRLGFKLAAIYHIALFAFTLLTSFLACFLSHKGWQISIIALASIPLFASTYRAVKNVHDGRKVASELKFTVLGVLFHNLAWILVLVIDYWFYQY